LLWPKPFSQHEIIQTFLECEYSEYN